MEKENIFDGINTNKLIKSFSGIWSLRIIGKEIQDERIEEFKGNECYTDCVNVIGISFKNDILKNWFYKTFEVETSKCPELNYYQDNNSDEIICKFSNEYLLKIFGIFKVIGKTPIIRMKKDYPITIEAEELFKIILAPKVEN